MNIKLTAEMVDKIENLLHQIVENEYWSNQRIATGSCDATEAVSVIIGKEKREFARDILGTLGIGVDINFANRSVELFDLKTQEVIK